MTDRGAPEALCLGETMALVTPNDPAPLEFAASFTLGAGGAESNVAMYLAALGHRAAWASRVGDEPLGRRLVSSIAAAGVNTDLVEVHPTAATGVYFKDPGPDGTRVHYYRAGSAASTMDEHFLADFDFDALPLLHLSGITPVLSESCDRLVRHLLSRERPAGSLVSFDVNHRPGLWPAERAAPHLRELADLADIVFVGLDEARTLWGVDGPAELRETLPGPRTVVVKDAANAAHALAGDHAVEVPALRVEVVEPVGAGDAFAAGYLSGLLSGADQVHRLRLGHLVAAHTLLSTEDQAPVPEGARLAEWLGCDDSQWRELRFAR